jgi:hypothetical protein
MSSPTPIDPEFRTWHFFVFAALATATVAVLLSPPTDRASLILVSLAIGAAGFTASALYRTLAPLAGRDTAMLAEPLGQRTRTALDKDKALALRAIKELEFDRAMGKVAAADYEEMMGRLRRRAAGLIAQLDASAAAVAKVGKKKERRARR